MELVVNIPKRGQKLTNGDVIKALFPTTYIGGEICVVSSYDYDWWNAVYEVPTVKKMCSNGYIGEVREE